MHRAHTLLIITTLAACLASPGIAEERPLEYAPAPAGNPLKGLVPYAGEWAEWKGEKVFPHSLEFGYVALSDLMLGYDEFNWQPLEKLLNQVAARGHQTTFRVWAEYPGKEEGIPQFLKADGLKVERWLYENTAPFPVKHITTPDYEDERFKRALRLFIAALGKKYDGDPRIGYITAGLLGAWGEWHTYPRDELFPGKPTQSEVLTAYEKAFKKTPILLRYPAGPDTWMHASNSDRPFGYHDDSFAWATLDTGRKEDDWFFLPAMKTAGKGALEKWKTQPIGGEIRPELWGKIFDDDPGVEQAQNFAKCVQQTHATWLMDTGMFEQDFTEDRKQRAIEQVRRMGYEFHVSQVDMRNDASTGRLHITLTLENRGVAPFYHDWNVELGAVDSQGELLHTWKTGWKLTGLLPDDKRREWSQEIDFTSLKGEKCQLVVRVVNPLEGGIPLRFANKTQDVDRDGWLSLGEIDRGDPIAAPSPR